MPLIYHEHIPYYYPNDYYVYCDNLLDYYDYYSTNMHLLTYADIYLFYFSFAVL